MLDDTDVFRKASFYEESFLKETQGLIETWSTLDINEVVVAGENSRKRWSTYLKKFMIDYAREIDKAIEDLK